MRKGKESWEEKFERIKKERIKKERGKLPKMSDEVRAFAVLSGKGIARTLQNQMTELDQDRAGFAEEFHNVITLIFRDYRGVQMIDDKNKVYDPLQKMEEINKMHSRLSNDRDQILERIKIISGED
jgi:hypothetical protein